MILIKIKFASFLVVLLRVGELVDSFPLHRPPTIISRTNLHRSTKKPTLYLYRPKESEETVTEEEFLIATPEMPIVLDKSAPKQLERAKPSTGDQTVDAEPQAVHLTDADFVIVDEDQLGRDRDMRMLSSELGVRKLLGDDITVDDIVPVGMVLERTMDTVEDIFVHLRRIPYEKGWSVLSPEQDATRRSVVILGSGWAAHALMKVADCNKLRLIVVSPTNHFLFTPMLASAAVGTVEYRSMTEAVRAANPMISEYVEGSATDIDVKKKTVTVKLNNLLDGVAEGDPPTLQIPYDTLVVSVGAKVDDKNVKGASERALRLKTCDDARRLRTAVGECFEYASRPDVASSDQAEERSRRVTFLIVGGGPTGVELAGELYDLVKDITRPHVGTYPKLEGAIRVVLAHGGTNLVPQFDAPLRSEALRSLQKKGVEVILNTRVTEVGDGFVRLSTKVRDPETGEISKTDREETILPVGLTVWCAGTAPVPFVEKLLNQLPDSARNRDGRVRVDKWMRPPMHETSDLGSVLVLGDAAALENNGGFLPQTAQVAGQQGAYAARILDRGYNLTLTPPMLRTIEVNEQQNASNVFFDPLLTQWLEVRGLEISPGFGFLNLGLLAYLGGGEALSQVQLGDIPVFSYAGSVAFMLWRSVYLVKQVATRNRILVTFDWIKSALFGRDITRL